MQSSFNTKRYIPSEEEKVQHLRLRETPSNIVSEGSEIKVLNETNGINQREYEDLLVHQKLEENAMQEAENNSTITKAGPAKVDRTRFKSAIKQVTRNTPEVKEAKPDLTMKKPELHKKEVTAENMIEEKLNNELGIEDPNKPAFDDFMYDDPNIEEIQEETPIRDEDLNLGDHDSDEDNDENFDGYFNDDAFKDEEPDWNEVENKEQVNNTTPNQEPLNLSINEDDFVDIDEVKERIARERLSGKSEEPKETPKIQEETKIETKSIDYSNQEFASNVFDNISTVEEDSNEKEDILDENDPEAIFGTDKNYRINRGDIPKSKYAVKGDLENIVIRKDGSFKDILALRTHQSSKPKPTSTVVLMQSGYPCQMTSLTNREIIALNESVATPFENFRKNLEIIYNKIEKTPFGKPNFEGWLKITSYFDLPTLFFGIYTQTFPYKNTFSLTCPKCNQSFEFEIRHGELAMEQMNEEKNRVRYDDILRNVKTLKDTESRSFIALTNRIQLPETGKIIDFKIASLYEYMDESLKFMTEDNQKKFGDALYYPAFIRSVMLPNSYKYEESGELEFYPITDKKDIMYEIINLTPEDGEYFDAAFENWISQYNIRYSAKNVKCSRCGYELGEVPIDLEQLLFFNLAKIRLHYRRKLRQ